MRWTIAIVTVVLIAAAGLVSGLLAAGATASRQNARTSALQAARGVPQRVVAAWAKNDAEAFGAVWTADGDFVVGDGTRLVGRRAITAYMRTGFAGPMKGFRATATVIRARLLSPTVALVQTRGGILMPGETKVPPERLGIQTWVVTKHGPRWLISSYQNTRIDQR